MAAAGGARAGIVPFILVTLALTIPVALASWMLVEQPALAFKNGVPIPRGLSRAHLGRWARETVDAVTAGGAAGAARLSPTRRSSQQPEALEAG